MSTFSTRHPSLTLQFKIGKLKWLKTHAPEIWRRAGHFFDLPDYLTFRATRSLSRSLCSLVCKWTYVSGDPSRREVCYARGS